MMENVFITFFSRHCFIVAHNGEIVQLDFPQPVWGQKLSFHFHVKSFRQEDYDL